MSWLSKILPPKLESTHKANIPEGLWVKCSGCSETLYKDDLKANLEICPKCGYHHAMSARDRIAQFIGTDFIEIAQGVTPIDFLGFVDSKSYADRIKQSQEKTGEKDALVCGFGSFNEIPVCVAAFEYAFIGGSMGSVVGEKFVQAVRYAAENNTPFICVASSGGARMQEGLTSLMQMTKTVASLTLLKNKSLPFISILANPTMGGVSASFAFIGDVVIAEPNALIGFAGPRVIEQTLREKLPDGFQSAEFLLKNGAIDLVVSRKELPTQVYNILSILTKKQ